MESERMDMPYLLDGYDVNVDDPNITIEEYIRLEEEKARRRSKVYNWETAKYGKIWYDEDVHDLRSVEIEFPAIVFNDKLTSEEALSFESMPEVSYSNDLDYFKDFENEFPAIVYNDALTSKLDFLTEPTISPQHIDEFNLKNETSLFEYTDNNNDKIDIKHSSGGNVMNTDDGAYAQRTCCNEIDLLVTFALDCLMQSLNKLLPAKISQADFYTRQSIPFSQEGRFHLSKELDGTN
ncbi:hypothetical protein Tco_0573330 [Tanacetum coccineum]